MSNVDAQKWGVTNPYKSLYNTTVLIKAGTERNGVILEEDYEFTVDEALTSYFVISQKTSKSIIRAKRALDGSWDVEFSWLAGRPSAFLFDIAGWCFKSVTDTNEKNEFFGYDIPRAALRTSRNNAVMRLIRAKVMRMLHAGATTNYVPLPPIPRVEHLGVWVEFFVRDLKFLED
jgi:hypothetical protein